MGFFWVLPPERFECVSDLVVWVTRMGNFSTCLSVSVMRLSPFAFLYVHVL